MTDFVKAGEFSPHQHLDLGLVPIALAPRSTVGLALDESTIYAIEVCVFLTTMDTCSFASAIFERHGLPWYRLVKLMRLGMEAEKHLKPTELGLPLRHPFPPGP